MYVVVVFQLVNVVVIVVVVYGVVIAYIGIFRSGM